MLEAREVSIGPLTSSTYIQQAAVETSVMKYLTNHSLKLNKRRSNKDLRLHFFSGRVVNRWSKLPASVLDATSINSFKSTTKAAIHTDQFL